MRDYSTQILNSLYMERQAPSCAQHYPAPNHQASDLNAEMGAAHRMSASRTVIAPGPLRLRKLLAWVLTAAACGHQAHQCACSSKANRRAASSARVMQGSSTAPQRRAQAEARKGREGGG